ncbi:MAG: hypothetical protein ACK5WR_18895 [Planctomycetaceae bacterium]
MKNVDENGPSIQNPASQLSIVLQLNFSRLEDNFEDDKERTERSTRQQM